MTRNGTHNSSLEGMNGTGFLHGARVGIVAKPSPEFVAGVFGTWLSGGVAVPLALSYPEAELLHVMNDSVCSKLIASFHFGILQHINMKMKCLHFLLPYYGSLSSLCCN